MRDTVVTFGEIMGRVTPPGFLRFEQSMPGSVGVTFAGAEANVAASIALLGGNSRFVSALPQNGLGDACLRSVSQLGIDTQYVVRSETGRLGLYFLESGANQRPSRIIYDRDGSSISLTPASAYDWQDALHGASWFHVTGITPAISETAATATIDAVKTAQQAGLTVSCDLNFRKKLWRWSSDETQVELARRTMRDILPHLNVVIANEEDAAIMLDIHAADTDVDSGQLAIDKYPLVARQIVEQFPNISRVGITLRESISASYNRWGAMLYDAADDHPYFAPLHDDKYRPYEITNIVDRVGAGDSFAAGLIFATHTAELAAPDQTVSFAAAASCLAHSIVGDCNFSGRAEVEALMKGSGSGRVVR